MLETRKFESVKALLQVSKESLFDMKQLITLDEQNKVLLQSWLYSACEELEETRLRKLEEGDKFRRVCELHTKCFWMFSSSK